LGFLSADSQVGLNSLADALGEGRVGAAKGLVVRFVICCLSWRLVYHLNMWRFP